MNGSQITKGSHVFHTNGRDILLSYEGPGGEVAVPEGIHLIGADAFALCTHVTGVTLPEGVQHIEMRAFYKSGIRTICLPSSPADLRRFAGDLEDGERDIFGWSSEPGFYPWIIQRRGGIFYVVPPNIEKGFFISREDFLLAADALTDEWNY